MDATWTFVTEHRRWPESHFPTPLLFQWIWFRNFTNLGIQLLFKLRQPYDATEIQQYPRLSNDIYRDYADSCYCRKSKLTPGPVFHKFFIPVPATKKRRILPESTPDLWPPLLSTLLQTLGPAGFCVRLSKICSAIQFVKK